MIMTELEMESGPPTPSLLPTLLYPALPSPEMLPNYLAAKFYFERIHSLPPGLARLCFVICRDTHRAVPWIPMALGQPGAM